MTLFDVLADGTSTLGPAPDFYPAYIGQYGWQCNGHDMWQCSSRKLGSAEWVECRVCDWTASPGTEEGTIVAWHDHAMPGWRELPIFDKPAGGASSKQFRAHIDTYPEGWRFPGGPVITRRSGIGTRSYMAVEFGGHDISHTVLGGVA